jgi:Domain of unknown function (DUF932)
MTATLLIHRGAVRMDRDQLERIDAPPPTASWFPLRHADVIDGVTKTLGLAGFTVNKADYAVSRRGARLFATMDLAVPLHTGVNLAVGIRNSTDKTIPLGFCAGSRVVVCDNLAFSAELMVHCRHTRYGAKRFREAIAGAVSDLQRFQKTESARIRFMQEHNIDDQQTAYVIRCAWQRGILSARRLPALVKEWRGPSIANGAANTVWRLFNAFTRVLGDHARHNPERHAVLTVALNELIDFCFPQIIPGPPLAA